MPTDGVIAGTRVKNSRALSSESYRYWRRLSVSKDVEVKFLGLIPVFYKKLDPGRQVVQSPTVAQLKNVVGVRADGVGICVAIEKPFRRVFGRSAEAFQAFEYNSKLVCCIFGSIFAVPIPHDGIDEVVACQ